MTDNHEHQKPAYPQIEYVVVEKQRRKWYRSPGCLFGLALWFLVMLTPMFFIILAIEGEITIPRGDDVPDRHRHPRLQISLLMEADKRGLSFTNTSIAEEAADTLCLQTNVRYLMWEGEGESVVYCECYTRDTPESEWFSDTTTQGTCSQRQDEP